jgi:hypothetical protein
LNRFGSRARAIRQLSAFFSVTFHGLVLVWVADGVGLAVVALALARGEGVVAPSLGRDVDGVCASLRGSSPHPEIVARMATIVAILTRCRPNVSSTTHSQGTRPCIVERGSAAERGFTTTSGPRHAHSARTRGMTRG